MHGNIFVKGFCMGLPCAVLNSLVEIYKHQSTNKYGLTLNGYRKYHSTTCTLWKVITCKIQWGKFFGVDLNLPLLIFQFSFIVFLQNSAF